jgi:hypothetical protein
MGIFGSTRLARVWADLLYICICFHLQNIKHVIDVSERAYAKRQQMLEEQKANSELANELQRQEVCVCV